MKLKNSTTNLRESNNNPKMKLHYIVVVLMGILGFASCNSSELSINETKEAKAYVEEFNKYEHLNESSVSKALEIIVSIINKINDNNDLKKFIGSDGMDYCTLEGLLPLVIAETRAEGKPGKNKEQGYFQIKPGAKRSLIEQFKKSGGNKEGQKLLDSDNTAGAILFLQICSKIDKMIDDGILDSMNEKETLQMAYIFYNRGVASGMRMIKQHDFDDRDDFDDYFVDLLEDRGLGYRKRKKSAKKFNENPKNSRKKKKISKLKRLQEIRKEAIQYPEIKSSMYNTYLAGFVVGIAYEEAEDAF